MTLRELIVEYRNAHGLSQRQFATQCMLSNGYISMIEKNINPKTGQPIVPSINAYQKIATAMGISVNELFEKIDDAPVDIMPDTARVSRLSDKEERDIAKRMKATLDELSNSENALMFDGEPLDDETRDLLRASLENQYRMARIIAKEKYTPKKYRNKDEG